jgi:2-methylfumaryl-CoA isomerase
MPGILSDLRVVEVSAFIAAPLGGMTLAQMGADVIRIDPIGGNIDAKRWPLAPDGTSLYWASLNKSKRSVCLALNTPQGQELAQSLIRAPGENAGILLTNLPAGKWMGYDVLKQGREDLIVLRLMGNTDGGAAIDYTVNCASGFPLITGQGGEPVNHVLPAWDIATGLYLSTGLLAAERARHRTGNGQEVTLSLADVMLASVANLGYVADVQVNNAVRQPLGNDLYGAFGRDFATSDNRRIMLTAISNRQWLAIGKATGLTGKLAMIGPMMDLDLWRDRPTRRRPHPGQRRAIGLQRRYAPTGGKGTPPWRAYRSRADGPAGYVVRAIWQTARCRCRRRPLGSIGVSERVKLTRSTVGPMR